MAMTPRKCLNRHEIIGYVGKDPAVKETRSNELKATFSVCTKRNWKDKKGEWQEFNEWHQVEAWGHLAKRAQKWFRRGMFVYVCGSVEHREWQKDGREFKMTIIRADEIGNMERVELEETPDSANSPDSAGGGYQDDEDSDLPF